MEKSLVDLMQEKNLGHQNVPDLCDERRGLKKRRFEAANKSIQRPSRKQRRMK